MLIDSVLPFRLSGKTFQLLLDNFLCHDFSIEKFLYSMEVSVTAHIFIIHDYSVCNHMWLHDYSVCKHIWYNIIPWASMLYFVTMDNSYSAYSTGSNMTVAVVA